MADAELGLLAQILGRVAYELMQIRPMVPTYLHLILSALFPIYTGAHASLCRPSSAAKPTGRKHRAGRLSPEGDDDEDDDDDNDDEQERLVESLSPSDALLMPLFAGTTLAALYFLLTWMQDPAWLNRIFNAYFAIFGLLSVSRLVADVLGVGHSIVFPRRYAWRGVLYHVIDKEETAVPVGGSIQDKQPIVSPLPGFLSRLPLSARMQRMLWADRAMLKRKWTLALNVHRIFKGSVRIGPHGLVGTMAGLVAVAYFNLVDKPWYLTNLLGFGFSYGALQLMSPTTFATGSLILTALFFYDIFFVFFTPMMVTVAKSLDVPIKLLFPRPPPADKPGAAASHAMLGLGDVVLPGIMIALALRFDLYLFYLRRQKRTAGMGDGKEERVEKPRYYSFAGRWSDHFWTHSLAGRPLWAAEVASEEPFTFPKIYFRACLIGYVLGLLATLGVMVVWDHAQPALLYLVPGVLGSLWLTALARGEWSLMWNYSEDVEEGETDKKVDAEKPSRSSDGGVGVKQDAWSHDSGHEILSFSIRAPRRLKKPGRVDEKPGGEHVLVDGKPTRASSGPVHRTRDTEPLGKRVRLQ